MIKRSFRFIFNKTNRRFSELPDTLNPLDGRYSSSIAPIKNYFTEKAFIKYRIETEIKWLIFLLKKGLAPLNGASFSQIERRVMH